MTMRQITCLIAVMLLASCGGDSNSSSTPKEEVDTQTAPGATALNWDQEKWGSSNWQ